MVDSTKGTTMADGIDDLAKRLQTVENGVARLATSVEGLSKSVEQLALSVDRRFDQVTAAIVEQRRYTEFAYSQLIGVMDARFGQVDARFAQIDGRFAQMDARFDRVEVKLDLLIAHFLPPPDHGATGA